jgi:hypothetical protein
MHKAKSVLVAIFAKEKWRGTEAARDDTASEKETMMSGSSVTRKGARQQGKGGFIVLRKVLCVDTESPLLQRWLRPERAGVVWAVNTFPYGLRS